MMNSTAILNFLKPKTIAEAVNKVAKVATNYVDQLIAVVCTLNTINEQNRKPTEEELTTLNQFYGYGKATRAFNPTHEANELLKQTLDKYSPTAYETAERGILTSYYTNPTIISAMWRTVLRLGVQDGYALEPSAGSGLFIKQSPSGFKGKFHAVELDPIAAQVCELTTGCKTYNSRLEQTKLNNTPYSLVIGNPPYGQIKARSKEFGSINILPYFCLRGLSELHNGGIMAYVVSSWFMDSKDSTTRQTIAKQANLIANVRLPSNQFADQGAQGVTTDILIFQRTETPELNPSWVNATEDNGWQFNDIYKSHPERIIGNIQAPREHSFASCEVIYSGESLEADLTAALDAQSLKPVFTMPIQNKGIKYSEPATEVVLPTNTDYAPNELLSKNGNIYQMRYGTGTTELEIKSPTVKKRILAYIEVKDALNALLKAEHDDEPQDILNQLRMNLNGAHQFFAKKFGPLSRAVNKQRLRSCSMYLRTRALELNYVAANKDEGTEESFDKATIFEKRIYTKPTRPTTANNPTEAAIVSFFEMGEINIPYISELLIVSQIEAADLCLEQGAIFLNPQTEEYELASSYLSGDIYSKIEAAKNAECPEDYALNIKALEEVKPERLSFEDIRVTFGASWVERSIYEDFICHLLGSDTKANVVAPMGKWAIKYTGATYSNVKSWETEDKDFESLFTAILNTSPIIVKRTDGDVTYIDRAATFEANEKADAILEEFEDWLPLCPNRRLSITNSYNEKMNAYVVPSFESISEYIKLDNCTMTPRPHQRRAIARALVTNASMGDLAVGSGKTLILQAICMLLKKMKGQSQTNIITMPNPLVEQFSSAFLEAFPAANVLTIHDKATVTEREELLHLAKTNNFDAVIMPQTTFTALQAPIETTERVIREEISDLREALFTAEQNNLSPRVLKRINRALEKKESDLEEITDIETLDSIDFEDLQPNFIAQDECQTVKNVPFTTAMSNVKGLGSPKGSKRAYDFFIKSKYVLENGGRVNICTGTAIANSVTEIVSWLKILGQDTIDRELLQVDQFIKSFCAPQTALEIDSTGRNLKLTTAIKKFQNLPELLRVYRSIAEVVSLDQLKETLEPLPDGRPAIPKLKNGAIKTEILPISEEQNEFFLKLVEKAKHLDKKNNMLKIMDLARKASLDIRHIEPELKPTNTVCDKIIENVWKIYQESRDFKGTQLIFMDRSISARHRSSEKVKWTNLFDKADSGDIDAIKKVRGLDRETTLSSLNETFSAYDELERRLTDLGLRVAVAHDYSTDAQKKQLKGAINRGEIDVTIGSTTKLGVGFNVNHRLYAIHHGDLPLRSGDYFQRNGRIERQGNLAYQAGHFDEVHVINYTTEKTLDSWFLNLLNRKKNQIEQFTNGDLNGAREYEPESDVIDFASLSAMVTGNSSFIELAESRLELKKLKTRKANIRKRVLRALDTMDYAKEEIERLTGLMPKLESDQAAALTMDNYNPDFGDTIREKSDSGTLLKLQQRRQQYKPTAEKPMEFATYGEFTLQAHTTRFQEVLTVKREHTYTVQLRAGAWGAQACLNAVERTLIALQQCAVEAKRKIAQLKEELSHAEVESTLTFNDDHLIDGLIQKIADLEEIIAEQEETERKERAAKKESETQAAA